MKHLACLKKLLKLGANIHAHDVAGYTPLHHCLTMYGGTRTLAMARVLLEHGADPNARNRFGASPLLECVKHKKVDFVKLLLEFGADPALKNLEGMSPQIMANGCSVICPLFAEPLKERCAELRKKAKQMGELETCRRCGRGSHCKRCAGCYLVWYCGKECQQADWAHHKDPCKEARRQYLPVKLETTRTLPGEKEKHVEIVWNHLTGEVNLPLVEQMKRQLINNNNRNHFVVKVQVPLNPYTPDRGLLLYNQDRTIMGKVRQQKNPESFPLLDTKVRSEGFNCNKGYFAARWDAKTGLRVNPHQLLPVETW